MVGSSYSEEDTCKMSLSVSGVAPYNHLGTLSARSKAGSVTIVLALFLIGLYALLDVFHREIHTLRSFSGASSFKFFSVGISRLTLRRSAYSPASRTSSSLAPGILFRWM